MPRLSICLLGPFQGTLDGVVLDGFESDKARGLLAYLVTEAGRPHRRETLATLLWPDWPQLAARGNLRRTLSNLRQVVGDRADRNKKQPFLLTSQQTIEFNQDSDAWVDVLALWEVARGPAVARASNEALAAAAGTYRGPFLEGFTVRDSTAFEEWALVTREQLARHALALLHELTRRYSEAGDHEQALAFARRQLAVEPWRELAHRQIMRSLALSGRRSEALVQFESLRKILTEELGVTPEQESIALYEQIRDGDFDRVGTGLSLPEAQDKPGHSLPAQLMPFVGRQEELAGLDALLADPNVRLLTILGPGGMGKTRLALEAAGRQIDNFRHGVYLASLAALESSTAIIPAIADGLAFSFYEGDAPQRQLETFLAQKQLLLLLDNFEHFLIAEARESTRLVRALLEAAPQLKIVVTSRSRLNIQGEYLYPLKGMDLPASKADEVRQSSAVQLFVTGARQVQPAFELTDDDARIVARICRHLQGMPLAILLAAGWSELLTPVQIAAELIPDDGEEMNLDLLETDSFDVPDRQRSLRIVFDHSWRLLSERERDICRQLAIFRGGFTQQEARAVTKASLRDLLNLLNRSLLYRDSTGRYDMHSFVRLFAGEHLAEEPALEAQTRELHSKVFCALLQKEGSKLKGPDQLAALATVEDELENGRAAWNQALEMSRWDLIDQATDAFGLYFEWRSRYAEGETHFGRAARQLEPAQETDQALRSLFARLLGWQSVFSHTRQRSEKAQALLERALGKLANANDVDNTAAFLYLQMGHLLADRADFENARQQYELARQRYREAGDRWGEANALGGLGYVTNRAGEYKQAEQLIEESLALYEDAEDARGSAGVLELLGYVLRDQGRLGLATEKTNEAVALYESLGDQARLADGHLALGWLHIYLGQSNEAYLELEKSAAIYAELGLPPPLSVMAIANLELGHYEQARAQLVRHIDQCHRSGDQDELAQGMNLMAALALATKQWEEAEAHLSRSMPILEARGQRDRWSHAAGLRGFAARGRGQPDEAWRYFAIALQTAVDIQAFITLLFVIPGAALLLADVGEVERTVELYAPLTYLPNVSNSQLRYDLAGKEIAALVEGLPNEVAEAAEKRGQERDLWETAAILLDELAARGLVQ